MSESNMGYDPRIIAHFEKARDKIVTSIPFNVKWRWGICLRGAIYDLKEKLNLGSDIAVKCVDDLGRNVIFMGTPLGTVTLYARPVSRGRTHVVCEVPEVFCEQGLFMRSTATLELAGLQHILSLEFKSLVAEIANELAVS